jgi:precorrin-2 dehydrogenase/sirohydrochlorin ferrochelatase
MNFRFPVFLDLTGKKCVVTGEGYEVAGKVQALVEAAAQVVYVNPSAVPAIEAMAAAGLIHWEKRDFSPPDLGGCFLLISDLAGNAEIFRLAEERGILCNCVDDPEHCRFSFGSIHRRGELTIAISTNGWAPAVAVRLKEKLQREIGPEYADFLELLKSVRPSITGRINDFAARRELWYRIVDSEVLAMLRRGEKEAAAKMVLEMIERQQTGTDYPVPNS